MSNEFYVNGDTLVGGTTANAADVKAEFDAIQAGFDKLPTEAQLKSGNLNYAVDSGAADAYVVTMPQTWTAYTAGWHLTFKVANANTGASTINVDGLGVKAIKKTDGSALDAGDLVAGALVTLVYDGTNFQVLNHVQGAVDAAEAARDAAQTAQTAAETAQGLAENAQTAAETAEANAEDSAIAAAASATAAAAAIGDIRLYPESESPAGWLEFDDSIYNVSTYADLYAKHPAWGLKFTDVEESKTGLSGTSIGIGGLFVDDDYVYIGTSGSIDELKIFDKTDWSVVSGPTISANITALCADTNYLYVSHTGSPYLTVYDKSDWSVVGGTPNPGNYAHAISVDQDYLYVGTSIGTVRVYALSDWSVAHSFSNSGTTYSFFSDGTYVYFSSNGSPYLKIIDRGTWGAVSGAPSEAAVVYKIAVDATYMYMGRNGSLEVYDIATWTLQSIGDFFTGSQINPFNDGSYLFVSSSDTEKLQIMDLSDNTEVATTTNPVSQPRIFSDGTYLYLAFVSGGTVSLSIINNSSVVEFRVPDSTSPIQGTKYLVRAE